MHNQEPGTLRGRLIQSLASLPGMNQSGQREFLLENAGYGSLTRTLDVQGGSAVSFFTSLVNTLALQGPGALADLVSDLGRVAAAGVDRREQLRELADQIRGMDPATLDEIIAVGTPFANLRLLARENTLREIAEVGSKYLRDLYFRHEDLEDRVEEFLSDDSVCLLVVSKPGRGKTSLLCSLAERTMEESLVLLMSARVPVSEPHGLLTLIAGRLGYGPDWPGCFADLARVSALGTPPLLMLDAINESPAKPDDMKAALHELLRQAENARLKVVITCRTDFWQFYRTSFWSSYVRQRALVPEGIRPSATHIEDVPLFPADAFPRIAAQYFDAFGIQGDLRGEAAERCRHALVLRILCEAYRGQGIGVIQDFRLFRLFKLFWERKVEQVADTTSLKGKGPVAELVLEVARLMRTARSTSVSRNAVADRLHCTSAELDSSNSLYSRIIDEEIILEESIDEELGVRNVVFIYDRFAEYVLALSLYLDGGWMSKTPAAVVSDARALMEEESGFPSLRGALEFLVLRLEDLRTSDLVHLDVVRAMLNHNWKWRGIATLLAFQFDRRHEAPFWDFLRELARHEVDFVRRIVAEQSPRVIADGDPRALRLLNDLLWDPNRGVREASRQALLSLPPAAVPVEVELLLATRRREAALLAARLLVEAPGNDFAELRRRAQWLADHGADEQLKRAVLEVLAARRGLAYTELPWLAACKASFSSATGPHADRYHAAVVARHEERLAELDDDRHFLLRLYDSLNDVLRPAVESGEEVDPQQHLLTRSPESVEGQHATSQPSFSSHGPTHRRLLSPAMTVWQQLLRTPGLQPRLIRVQVERTSGAAAQKIADLWQATYQVATALQSALDPQTSKESWISFCRNVARQAGLDMTDTTAVALAHPEQLALWLWHSRLERRERSGGIGALVSRLEVLSVSELIKEFEAYQHPVHLARQPLADLLEALCLVLRDRSTQPAQVLAPLVIWHESQDSEIVDEALDELHWLDPDSFWFVVQSLLNHPDQRLVNAATRAGERAEQVGESRSRRKREILDGLAEIVNEIAGIPIEEVHIGASFTDDLDIDSLSLVEVVVASEERFEVRIRDEDVMGLRTVRDAVDYIARRSEAARA